VRACPARGGWVYVRGEEVTTLMKRVERSEQAPKRGAHEKPRRRQRRFGGAASVRRGVVFAGRRRKRHFLVRTLPTVRHHTLAPLCHTRIAPTSTHPCLHAVVDRHRFVARATRHALDQTPELSSRVAPPASAPALRRSPGTQLLARARDPSSGRQPETRRDKSTSLGSAKNNPALLSPLSALSRAPP
jgi:hypothetical protein